MFGALILRGVGMETSVEKQLHELAKNIDYSLRMKEAKYVLVASDNNAEGKSTFLAECAPFLSKIYKKKVLIYDCQADSDDVIERTLKPLENSHQFIRATQVKNLDYINAENLNFLNSLPDGEKTGSVIAHFNEITRDYDVVFINMKTLKRAEKSLIPSLPIDGAILIRSPLSTGLTTSRKEKHITNELLDREIPIIGLVNNEGIK